MSGATNEERAQRGSLVINSYIDMEGPDSRGPHEAAVDAITDILHAYCEPGDELEAENMLNLAKMHFVTECDQEEASNDDLG